MTLQEAKSIARHLGLTLRQVRSGAYRVNFRDGNEMTAYYTDNLEDAVKTAVEMARTRDVTQAVDEAVAVERVQGRIADLRRCTKAGCSIQPDYQRGPRDPISRGKQAHNQSELLWRSTALRQTSN